MISFNPRVVVISGLPGAGKSTTAALLASRLPHAAHIEADKLQSMILAGGEWPDGGPNPSAEAVRQLRLRLRNSCLLARSFVESGYTAVVDDIIIGSRLEELLEDLKDMPLSFIMLNPDYDFIRQRWLAMNSPFADSWKWIDDEIQTNTRRMGLWLDTTDFSPEQVVDKLLNRFPETVVTV